MYSPKQNSGLFLILLAHTDAVAARVAPIHCVSYRILKMVFATYVHSEYIEVTLIKFIL